MVFKGLKKFTEKLIGTTHISYDDEMQGSDDEYVEVKPQKNADKDKLVIKYFILNDYADIKTIIDYVREGNAIIFANIKPLRSKDLTELKRAISKIKKTCEAIGGDIVGLEENFLLIYPDFVKVSKQDFE